MDLMFIAGAITAAHLVGLTITGAFVFQYYRDLQSRRRDK